MKSAIAQPRLGPVFRYAAIAAAGVLVALLAYRLWSFETRYIAAAVVGLLLVAISMAFLRNFADYLLVALLCTVPLANFCKYLFMGGFSDREFGILRHSGVMSVGVVDLLLLALYGLWFIRIFVTRQAPIPRFEKPDLLPLLLLAAYILSVPGSPSPKSGFFAIFYLSRFLLIYLYISRHFESRHIVWLLAAVAGALMLESGLAIIQYTTGKFVGLALDRGQGVRLHHQYVVPGIEHRTRATGTLSESHTFGIYVSMLLQYAFVLVAYRGTTRLVRTLAAGFFLLGTIAILISFSRASWVSCFIALALAWFVRVVILGEKQLVMPTLAIPLLLAPFAPWGLEIIIERFASAGGELLQARFEQYPVAWDIWMDHFLFGHGVGNYMKALEVYNFGGAANLPVHNAFLWAAASTGLFGAVVFIALLFTAILRCWKVVRRQHEPTCRIALAAGAGLVAYVLDGLTDPLYREPVVYMMVWVSIAVSVALIRIERASRGDATTPS